MDTEEQAEAAEPLTLYLVKRLELVIRALMDDALRPLGLTTLQYTAMSVLEGRGALSSAQLARRSFLRPQTMHEMVLTLEKRGLLVRKPQPDNKRILLATLTGRAGPCSPKAAPRCWRSSVPCWPDSAPTRRPSFARACSTASRPSRRCPMPVALGPIIDRKQLDHVRDLVDRSVAAGARLVARGTHSRGARCRPDDAKGWTGPKGSA